MIRICFALFLVGISFTCQSQNFYFSAGSGYEFAACKQEMEPSVYSTPGNTTYTSNSYSLGKGIHMAAVGGYWFGKYIGAELGIAFLNGQKTTQTQVYKDATGATSLYATYSLQGSMLCFTPAIRFQCGEHKWHPYMVCGMILGLDGRITEEYYTVRGIYTTDIVALYSGRVQFGVHSSAGMLFKLTNRIGFFGEISANLLNMVPRKSVITKETAQGKDNLPGLSLSQKETDYQSSYTTNSTSNPNSPSLSTFIHFPFSSIGFCIGIHYALSKN